MIGYLIEQNEKIFFQCLPTNTICIPQLRNDQGKYLQMYQFSIANDLCSQERKECHNRPNLYKFVTKIAKFWLE